MNRYQNCNTCRFCDKESLMCRVKHIQHPITPEYWCGEWALSPEFIEDKIRFEAIDYRGNVVDQATLILPPRIEKSYDISLSASKVTIRVAFYSQENKAWTELTSS